MKKFAVNLDAMPVSELQDFCHLEVPPDPALMVYANLKILAIQCRLAGNIIKAVRLEAKCDALYEKLTPGAKW